MKKLAVFLVFVALAAAGKSQGLFDLGLKAGINSSKISMHAGDYTPQTVNNYLVGAFARINLGRIYFQPEAYYNSKGGEYINKIDGNTLNKFNLDAVDVPVLLGVKLINQKDFNLRIMAGPTFSFSTNKSVSGQLSQDNLKNSFIGWQYGAGIDFLFLTFDARMESLSNNLYVTPDFNSKNGIFLLSLGIKLF